MCRTSNLFIVLSMTVQDFLGNRKLHPFNKPCITHIQQLSVTYDLSKHLQTNQKPHTYQIIHIKDQQVLNFLSRSLNQSFRFNPSFSAFHHVLKHLESFDDQNKYRGCFLHLDGVFQDVVIPEHVEPYVI